MKTTSITLLILCAIFALSVGNAQPFAGHASVAPRQNGTVIRMTGVRFAYPLIEQWIERYREVNPDVQIVIEWRGSQDPSEYDILVEAYEQPEEVRKQRQYVYVARYAILPVANSKSEFAKTYKTKGLTTSLIKQVFFHDIFADKKDAKIAAPYTVYTRMQKAGSPIVFSNYFRYEQKDIKGKGIAGSDEHLLKAVLRDSIAVSYLPVPSIYSLSTGVPVDGLTVLPVDINGNDRVSDDENFYENLSAVIERFETKDKADFRNVPIEHLHLSIDKSTANKEALAFIRWIIDNGGADLKDFGYFSPDNSRKEKETFEAFISRRGGNG